MYKEFEVNEHLVYLDNLLLGMQHCIFDKDVLKALEKLQKIVDRKLYSKLKTAPYDIADSKLIYRYWLEK